MNSITRQALMDETLRRGWTFEEIDSNELYFKITDDQGRSNLGRGGRFMGSSANGVSIAINKGLTYEIISSYGYRLPAFMVHTDFSESKEFLQRYKVLVAKPADAEKSRGVTAGITTPSGLDTAITTASKESRRGRVILQEQLEGNLYRVLVIGGKLFAASYRRAAFVTGDGVSTIAELVNVKNRNPLRSLAVRPPLALIDTDEARQFVGNAYDTVLPVGAERDVSSIASVSRGGEAQDVTDFVNPELAHVLEYIAQTLHLDVCGYDIIMDDIAVYDASGYLPLLEVNSMPGYKLHLFPTAGGIVRNPAPAVIDLAFGQSTSRY